MCDIMSPENAFGGKKLWDQFFWNMAIKAHFFVDGNDELTCCHYDILVWQLSARSGGMVSSRRKKWDR